MQETFIVSVTTEDGKLLVQKKILSEQSSSLSILSQLFALLSSVSENCYRVEIGVGSGNCQCVQDS